MVNHKVEPGGCQREGNICVCELESCVLPSKTKNQKNYMCNLLMDIGILAMRNLHKSCRRAFVKQSIHACRTHVGN